MNKNSMQKASASFLASQIVAILAAPGCPGFTSSELAEKTSTEKEDVLLALKGTASSGTTRRTGRPGQPVLYVLTPKALKSVERAAAEGGVTLAPVPAEVAPAPTVEPVVAAPVKRLIEQPVSKRGVSYAPAYLGQIRAAFESELPVMPGVERDYVGRRFVGLLGEGFTVQGAKAHLSRYVKTCADHTATVIAAVATPASEADIAAFVDAQPFARVAQLPVD
jgi:hypothetical protein